MTKQNSIISVNVPKEVKEEANQILNDLGLNMSTAVNMYLRRIIADRGIPFEIREADPNQEFLDALEELDYMEKHPEEYKSYQDLDELKKDLLSDD